MKLICHKVLGSAFPYLADLGYFITFHCYKLELVFTFLLFIHLSILILFSQLYLDSIMCTSKNVLVNKQYLKTGSAHCHED